VKKSALVLCLFSALAAAIGQDDQEEKQERIQIDIPGAQSEDQLRSGVLAYHRGFYGDAIVYLSKALTIQPANTLAQIWLGRTQWKSGFEQDAIRTWERLVDSGQTVGLLRDWVQRIRLRNGTARELPRTPIYVVSAELAGSQPGGYPFKRPSSIRTRADGSFFLVAYGSSEIMKYDVNFRLLENIRGGLEGFDRPYDIVEAPDGTLYVSEFGANRISKCNARGDRISTFGGKGTGSGALLGPQYLAIDERGFIYVSDWGNSRVNKYSPDGGFVLSIKGLSKPSGISVWENRLFVCENGKKRISIYDTDGNFIASMGEDVLASPEGVSVTPEGKLLVADSNRILEADAENERWAVVADTSSHSRRLIQQAMTPNGDILAADFDGSSVLFLTDSVSLYSGLEVHVDRIDASRFPDVFVDVSVESRFGQPVVGLGAGNFMVTESGRSVGPIEVPRSLSDTPKADVVLLVESSPSMKEARSVAEQAASELYASITANGRIKAVSAGQSTVKETEFGAARLSFLSEAFKAPASPAWRFDAGLRIAGEDLIAAGGRAKRAVVFLSSGSLTSQSFSTFSLMELSAFLRNNSIAFYPVSVDAKGMDADLSFLASETGGKAYGVFTPGGMGEVAASILSRKVSIFTVSYRSSSASKFGLAYIPFEIEVSLQKKSGRDECGYYAPQSQ
jgi:DNA-binding beta-propeller fold protein YncE